MAGPQIGLWYELGQLSIPTNFIHNGVQEKVSLHHRSLLIQTSLESSVTTHVLRMAEKETKVLWASTHDGFTFIAGMLDEKLCIGDVEGNQRSSQILVSSVLGCCCCQIPLTHHKVYASNNLPQCWQGLKSVASSQRPKTDPNGESFPHAAVHLLHQATLKRNCCKTCNGRDSNLPRLCVSSWPP